MRRIDPIRRAAREEHGAISITGALVAAALLLGAYALLGAATGDPTRFGRIPVPSTSLIALPAEEVDVSYLEHDSATGGQLQVPSDLRVVVTDPGTGYVVDTSSRGGSQSGQEGSVARPIAALRAPREATYEVEVRSDEARGRPGAAIAFGESPVGAVGDRFSRARELLISGYGAAAAGLLVLAALLPGFRRALRRRHRAAELH